MQFLFWLVLSVGCTGTEASPPLAEDSFEVFWDRESPMFEDGAAPAWLAAAVDTALGHLSASELEALDAVDWDGDPDVLLEDPAVFALCEATYEVLLRYDLVESSTERSVEARVVIAWAKTGLAVLGSASIPFIVAAALGSPIAGGVVGSLILVAIWTKDSHSAVPALPPGCAASPQTFGVGASGATQAGLSLAVGDGISVDASGRWCWGGGADCSGPNGTAGRPNADEGSTVVAGAQFGELLAQLDGVWMVVGTHAALTAGEEGDVAFKMNDLANAYGDNSGSLTVSVSVCPH